MCRYVVNADAVSVESTCEYGLLQCLYGRVGGEAATKWLSNLGTLAPEKLLHGGRESSAELRQGVCSTVAGFDEVDRRHYEECVSERDDRRSEVRSVVGSTGASNDTGAVAGIDVGSGRVLGPNGGVSYGRGENYVRNQLARKRKKCLKKQDKLKELEEKAGVVGLQLSLGRKWAAENALAEKKALQQLELLEARDMGDMKRMQRAQTMRTTELCKVQTERAFATLKRTGNVTGFAETVVSDPSLTSGSTARSSGDCISPDSSVSQQEIREMQRRLLEAERALDKVKENDPKLHAFAVRIGGLKTAFTLDSDGGIPIDEEGEIGLDGKFHMAFPRANVVTIKQREAMDEDYERYLMSLED